MRTRLLTSHAFSLVELSIVLVILGLLVGGILAGQSLIRAAELRQIGNRIGLYQTSMQTFNDKYRALPGDMPNATNFWGVQNATPATCVDTSSSDSKTCDGDGNGQIDVSAGSNEPFRVWQHLTNAGLLEGAGYTGVKRNGYAGQDAVHVGVNVPTGPPKIGYHLSYIGSINSGSQYYWGNYGNALLIGGNVNGLPNRAAILSPAQAWNIDTKLDDGNGTQGRLVMLTPTFSNNCISGWNITDSYVLATSTSTCAFFYRQLI